MQPTAGGISQHPDMHALHNATFTAGVSANLRAPEDGGGQELSGLHAETFLAAAGHAESSRSCKHHW